MGDIVVPSGPRDRLEALIAGRRDAIVVAGLVAAVVFGAMMLRGDGAVATVAPPSVAPEAPAQVTVHVAGAVRHPGLYLLHADQRVADAIEAAGGPVRRADLNRLNLAEPVRDGQKIEVLRRGDLVADVDGGPSVVSINSADAAALETLPGIGPAKAAAIIRYRDTAGGFDSIADLLAVPGIGPATLEAMRDYLTL